MNDYIKMAYRLGKMPNWAWYQLNGQAAHTNWIEQREKMLCEVMDQNEVEDDTYLFSFTSEVKVK